MGTQHASTILTDNVNGLEEDVAEDVEVEVPAALDTTKHEAVARVPKGDVLRVHLVERVADGELDVGDRRVRGELVAALLVVVRRALDRT